MSKKTGGRPPKPKGLIDVAKWMPQIRRDLRDRITQIKQDVARIKL